MALIQTAQGEKSVKNWHHCLKIWPEHFWPVASNSKRAEFRRDDRGFEVGDYLDLAEFMPEREIYTGNKVLARITHIARGGSVIPDGYAMLSIQVLAVWA